MGNRCPQTVAVCAGHQCTGEPDSSANQIWEFERENYFQRPQDAEGFNSNSLQQLLQSSFGNIEDRNPVNVRRASPGS